MWLNLPGQAQIQLGLTERFNGMASWAGQAKASSLQKPTGSSLPSAPRTSASCDRGTGLRHTVILDA